MKIRKYQGSNETEAMLKVKEELGKEALIVSIKNIKPKGFYKLFKKPYVEVTAALDDKSMTDENDDKPLESFSEKLTKVQTQKVQEKSDVEYIEKFQKLIENMTRSSNEEEKNSINHFNNIDKKFEEEDNNSDEEPVIKVIYEQLLENDIKEEVANYLTNGLAEMVSINKVNIDDVISVIYKRIVKILSDNEPIQLNKTSAKTVVFVGPTGVGKTTTIAKIASYFTLNLNKKVALVTADTYRIAAVEQLRTYANILNIPIKVVYTADELEDSIKLFKDKDLILVDTAGRSFKNKEHQDEIIQLVNNINDKEVFLVLSLTTKYNDLLDITKAYEDISDYKIVFTKLDETSSFGNVLNIKRKTGAKLSYVTFGQNVPDDISEINPHEVAKKILGGNE